MMNTDNKYKIKRIGRSIYPLRVFGFFLFGISLLLSHYLSNTSHDLWSVSGIIICLVYPHLAYLRYLQKGSSESEVHHMLIDMGVLGLLTALIGFTPAVALPYIVANSSANYALRGIKQALKSTVYLVLTALVVFTLSDIKIKLNADIVELICPFLYLIVTTHYMGYLAYVRGVTLVERKKQAEEFAQIDFLTGLNNRRSMFQKIKLNDDIKQANDTTLIMIDLDFFKKINDEYGHDHGDAVLVQISELIQRSIRETDVVARWGGEEFLILLPKTNCEQGLAVAESVRSKIEKKSIFHGGIEHRVTSTFGVATYGANASFEDTITRADKALYNGKKQGRNRVVFCGATLK